MHGGNECPTYSETCVRAGSGLGARAREKWNGPELEVQL